MIMEALSWQSNRCNRVFALFQSREQLFQSREQMFHSTNYKAKSSVRSFTALVINDFRAQVLLALGWFAPMCRRVLLHETHWNTLQNVHHSLMHFWTLFGALVCVLYFFSFLFQSGGGMTPSEEVSSNPLIRYQFSFLAYNILHNPLEEAEPTKKVPGNCTNGVAIPVRNKDDRFVFLIAQANNGKLEVLVGPGGASTVPVLHPVVAAHRNPHGHEETFFSWKFSLKSSAKPKLVPFVVKKCFSLKLSTGKNVL
jgi:hypothetical protein